MKQMMKKAIKTMLCTMLVLGLVLNVAESMTMRVYAAEELGTTKNVDMLNVELMDMSAVKPPVNNAKTVLVNCEILYAMNTSGLQVSISTGCGNGAATYLGVKDIKIEKKVWYGWQTVATGSGGQQSNCSIMGVQFNYANMTVGETYRISCVHYGDYNGYHELSNQTSAFVFSY